MLSSVLEQTSHDWDEQWHVQVTSGHVVLGHKWLLLANDLINTVVGVEGGLDVVEDHDGAVSTASSELSGPCNGRGNTNGIVESPDVNVSVFIDTIHRYFLQTKRLVDFLSTFATVEEVGLNVVANSEESAAGRVRRSVLAVGARNTLGNGG